MNLEAFNIVIDTSLNCERVIRELRLAAWCSEQNSQLPCIHLGKPSQNGFFERFNRSYREEILDAHWFNSLEEVRQLTHRWSGVYNHDRPHEALGNLVPRHFLLKYGTVGDDFLTFQQDQFF